MNFIYVFDTAARDRLSEAGFLLLKTDEKNSIWVFAGDDTLNFSLDDSDLQYTTSNVLTF